MFAKCFSALVVIGVVALLACEGDPGPAGPAGPAGPPGPSTILAFGDVDFTVGAGNDGVLSFGPSNTVDSVTVDDTAGDGIFNVTCFGSFPNSAGTLVVSTSSDQGVANDIATTATITTWSNASIAFTAQTFNTNTAVLDGEDFSFVIFGE